MDMSKTESTTLETGSSVWKGERERSGSWSLLSQFLGPIEVRPPAFQQMVPVAVSIPEKWRDPEYRHAYMEAAIDQGVAWQIRVNREERGWTQAELAQRIDSRQSAVSRLEDPEAGDVRLSTLKKVARALDCALIVRFASYSELASLSSDLGPDRLYAASFTDEFAQESLTYER
ncbi:MAG: helix-turn-helix transcriptional regulator [Burkholderiaceae bacterium]|nr:helix-turn-helix transcriptional regulator [Burkholderiaceae bacterium]